MTATEPARAVPADTSVIRVVVAGPEGRMGRAMMAGLPNQAGIEVVGGLSRGGPADDLLAGADVLVEFTRPDSAPDLMLRAIEAGVRPVSGTSGLPEDVLAAVDSAARERGIAAVWAPNYSLAAVLMIHFSRIAARYLDSVEIVEAHHTAKLDAPSGTAWELARQVRKAHGSDLADAPARHEAVPGTRGGVEGGVRIHSLRLPGVLGWHEIVFSDEQSVLTIRQEDGGNEGYVPTVAQAVRAVMRPGAVGLIRGYESVIGLTDDRERTSAGSSGGA